MALVGGRADDGISAGASTGLASVRARTAIAVAAGRTVRFVRVRAGTGRRVAGAHNMALIERRAHDRVSAGASTILTGIGTRTSVAVAADGSVGGYWIGASTGRGAASARHVASIERGTGDRWTANAGTAQAGVPNRTTVAVAAGDPIVLGRIRACTRSWIAGAGSVALVQGCAGDRVRAYAASGHASVILRAPVAVVARSAIGLGRIRAQAGCRIADTGRMALVGWRAHDWRAGLAQPRGVARFCAVAGIAVTTARPCRACCMRANPNRASVNCARIAVIARFRILPGARRIAKLRTLSAALHTSFFVQAFPSSQEAPDGAKLQALWLELGLQTWHRFAGFTSPSAWREPSITQLPGLGA